MAADNPQDKMTDKPVTSSTRKEEKEETESPTQFLARLILDYVPLKHQDEAKLVNLAEGRELDYTESESDDDGGS